MCTKKTIRRKNEEQANTIRVLEEEIQDLRAKLARFDYKNRKRDGKGRFIEC